MLLLSILNNSFEKKNQQEMFSLFACLLGYDLEVITKTLITMHITSVYILN